MLSGVSVDEFARLVQSGDVAALTRIPGIGKKTAERMRGRAARSRRRTRRGVPAQRGGAVPADPVAEATVALQTLGYKPAEVTRLVRDAAAPGDRAEDIIRKALQGGAALSRKPHERRAASDSADRNRARAYRAGARRDRRRLRRHRHQPAVHDQARRSARTAVPPTEDNVLGVLSLMFWSLMLVVSVKYVGFIMRADNKGEGGIMALTALAQRSVRASAARALVDHACSASSARRCSSATA